MKKILSVLSFFTYSSAALADRYGLNESMGESDATFQEMLLGGLLCAVVYWLWKKWRG